jgi:hypothetical protein
MLPRERGGHKSSSDFREITVRHWITSFQGLDKDASVRLLCWP